MKTYAVADLVREVKIVLDENRTTTSLIEEGDEDTLTLNEIISAQLPVAAQIVEVEAPLYMLGEGESLATSISWSVGSVGKGRGMVVLPDNFLRLVCFQMSDWERPITEVIDSNSPKYAQQFSRHKGLRGSPQSPVAAIINTPAGLTLEFFSCEQGESISVLRARYVPRPIITENHEIRLCEKLKRSIVYYTAHLVEIIHGETECAQAHLKTSSDLAK